DIGDGEAAARESEIHERYATTSRVAYHRWSAGLERAGRLMLEGRFEETEACLAALAEYRNMERGLFGAVSGSIHQLREQQGRVGDDLPQLVRMAAQNPGVTLWWTSVAIRRAAFGDLEEARKDYEYIAAKNFSD